MTGIGEFDENLMPAPPETDDDQSLAAGVDEVPGQIVDLT